MKKQWDSEALFFSGDSYYDDVIAAIEAATKSVDFETYIFINDVIGQRFEAAMVRALQRGVRVRLVVDGIGARIWIETNAHVLRKKGVEVRVFHPLRILALINRRDHRKMVLVDRETAWVGSLNIAAEHSQKASGLFAWQDIAAKVTGSQGIGVIVSGFEYSFSRSHDVAEPLKFLMPWVLPGPVLAEMRRARRDLNPTDGSTALVRQNYTRRLRRLGFRHFLLQLASAKKKVWIINAYLAPSPIVMRHLKRAARRGIDVRVIVPRKSDVFFMPWVAGAHYRPLLRSGVRIFEFLPRFHHGKMVLIDHWATVGTTNLNNRSLKQDLELDVILRKTETLDALSDQFAFDLTQCEEVRRAPGGIRSFLGRMILAVFKNWL